MWISGVGTGLGLRMREVLIHTDLHLLHMASVFCVAEIGPATPISRVAPVVLPSIHGLAAASVVFVVLGDFNVFLLVYAA